MTVKKALLGVATAFSVVFLATGSVSAASNSAQASNTQAASCGTFSTTNPNTPTVNGSSVYVPVYVSGCFDAPSTTSEVTVNIDHPRRGDLTIDLVAYDGTEYRLKNKNLLDWRDDVNQTYTVNLSSEQANAPWFLKVTDGYSSTTGIVVDWSLKL